MHVAHVASDRTASTSDRRVYAEVHRRAIPRSKLARQRASDLNGPLGREFVRKGDLNLSRYDTVAAPYAVLHPRPRFLAPVARVCDHVLRVAEFGVHDALPASVVVDLAGEGI